MATLNSSLRHALEEARDSDTASRAAHALLEAHRAWITKRASHAPTEIAAPLPSWVPDHSAVVAWMNRVALLQNLLENEPRIEHQPWPDRVKDLCREDFRRMVDGDPATPPDAFGTDNVRFQENLRVSSFSRIPLGVCYAEVAGVPRSWLLRAGPVVTANLTSYLMREAGGFRPFLDLHVNPYGLTEFNSEGWDRSWRLAAEMIELNDGLRGIQCSAWFNDPGLRFISPRLAYLRQRYVDNGGVCFRVGGEEDEKMLALLRSPTRRALFAQGRYAPCVYMCIWGRRPLLVWARS